MAGEQPPVLEMIRVSRNYGALRPLRVAALAIASGERVTIGGLDAGAGEALVNLVTGASLPDAGEVRVFGRLTSDIADGDQWLDSLDHFGIVSPRGVLLGGSALLQNLAMPFTLQIDPVPPEVAAEVVHLARRCGIEPGRWLDVPAAALPPAIRVRAHVARALALKPRFLVIEHPTADLDAAARLELAADLARACNQDRVTALILTNDEPFARRVATRNLRLVGATGALKPIGRGWFA
jgi:predicted ABC-type transport system involved in lysophospholipase L1 biosynthesis ATPase subunit